MPTILAIDDKSDNLVTLSALLKMTLPDVTVQTARSGAEGIAKAKVAGPDVILLDIVMPEMDGYEVCRRLKTGRDTRHIPIIMLTALETDTQSRIKGLQAGAEAFLTKPIDEGELCAQINVMLRIRRTEALLLQERDSLDRLVRERTAELEKANRDLCTELVQRKQAEEAIRLSEEKFRTLYEHMVQGVFYQFPDGSIREANGAMLDIFGLTLAQLQGRTSLDPSWRVIHEDGSEFSGEMHPSWIALQTGKAVTDVVAGIFNPIKEAYVWVSINAIPQFKEGEDKPYQTFVTMHDITVLKKTQEKFQAARDELKLIFDLTPDMICAASPNGYFTRVNPAFAEVLGYTEEEILAMPYTQLIHPDDLKSTHREIEKQLRGGATLDFVNRYRHKDGSYRTLEWRSTPEKGGVLYAAARDITERRQAEAARLLLEKGIEQAGEAVLITNTEGLIQYVNPAFEAITGYTQAEVLGRNPNLLQSGRHGEDFYKELWATITSGKTWQGEFINCRKDGRVYYEMATISPVKDEIGRIINYIAVKEDVTERRRTEDELVKINEQLNACIDNMPNAYILWDLDLRAIEWNKAAEEIFGYSREEMLGKNPLDFIVPEGAKHMVGDVLKNLKAGVMSDYSNKDNNIRKDGKLISCQWFNRPLLDSEGDVLGVLTLAQDVTQRLQAEEILRKNQQQLKSLASELVLAEERERQRIALCLHDEVCQSLAFVKMNLQIVNASLENQAHSRDVLAVCETLTQMMQEVRSLTFELSSPILSEFGLEAAVSNWLKEQIEQKHGMHTVFSEDGQDKPLSMDVRAMLFRSVRELLTNAVKYSEAQSVAVRITREGNQVVIAIEDDGIGFVPEMVVVSRESGGYGLFSIRERLDQLGGVLEIHSSPGSGCQSILRAPLKPTS